MDEYIPEIVVSPQMIAACVSEAREHPLGCSLESLVSKIYLAMLLEAQDGGSVPASSTSSVK